jgi:hypothetical protein
MSRKKPRDVTGVLVSTPPLNDRGSLHFLRTTEGHHWRLVIEPERVQFLVGLKVRVQGLEENGVIHVRGIAQAS